MINKYDWGKSLDTDEKDGHDIDDGLVGVDDHEDNNSLPGVIVKEDPDAGYVIVNKPPGVPVHPTVGE